MDSWIFVRNDFNLDYSKISSEKMMTDEKIHYYCCVCGARLPGMTAYELKDRGFAVDMGDGSFIFFCAGKRHTEEDIKNAAKFAPGFHRASEERR